MIYSFQIDETGYITYMTTSRHSPQFNSLGCSGPVAGLSRRRNNAGNKRDKFVRKHGEFASAKGGFHHVVSVTSAAKNADNTLPLKYTMLKPCKFAAE